MRSLALTALLGSFVVTASLSGQSLTEHAAAAAGATIGTAAGKPLGTALGKVFGDVDKTASTAVTPKTTKPAAAKPAAEAKPETVVPAATIAIAPAGGGGGEVAAGGGGGGVIKGGLAHPTARHREAPVEAQAQPVEAAPLAPIVLTEPVFKEPTVQDVANIRVGASANEMRALLGAPESKVSIPDDDGHLLEICQYWAKGEQLGTIRLDNGRVVSVQVNN
jgi:hypothetical protein